MRCFILGMHRSGTSILTKLLNHAGLHVGSEDYFGTAKTGNPTGHWERIDVCIINDTIFDHLNATWYDVGDLNIENPSGSDRTAFDARIKTVLNELDTHQPWVNKDPRHCILFTFWKSVANDSVAVIIFRKPVEVALSLQKLYNFPIPYGLALWEIYMLSAVKHSHDIPRHVVSHHDVVSNKAHTVLTSTVDFLNDTGKFSLQQPSPNIVKRAIRPDLYRSRELDDQISAMFLTTEQQKLYELLEAKDLDAISKMTLSQESQEILASHADWYNIVEKNKRAQQNQGLQKQINGDKVYELHIQGLKPFLAKVDAASSIYRHIHVNLIGNKKYRDIPGKELVSAEEVETGNFIHFSLSQLTGFKVLSSN